MSQSYKCTECGARSLKIKIRPCRQCCSYRSYTNSQPNDEAKFDKMSMILENRLKCSCKLKPRIFAEKGYRFIEFENRCIQGTAKEQVCNGNFCPNINPSISEELPLNQEMMCLDTCSDIIPSDAICQPCKTDTSCKPCKKRKCKTVALTSTPCNVTKTKSCTSSCCLDKVKCQKDININFQLNMQKRKKKKKYCKCSKTSMNSQPTKCICEKKGEKVKKDFRNSGKINKEEEELTCKCEQRRSSITSDRSSDPLMVRYCSLPGPTCICNDKSSQNNENDNESKIMNFFENFLLRLINKENVKEDTLNRNDSICCACCKKKNANTLFPQNEIKITCLEEDKTELERCCCCGATGRPSEQDYPFLYVCPKEKLNTEVQCSFRPPERQQKQCVCFKRCEEPKIPCCCRRTEKNLKAICCYCQEQEQQLSDYASPQRSEEEIICCIYPKEYYKTQISSRFDQSKYQMQETQECVCRPCQNESCRKTVCTCSYQVDPRDIRYSSRIVSPYSKKHYSILSREGTRDKMESVSSKLLDGQYPSSIQYSSKSTSMSRPIPTEPDFNSYSKPKVSQQSYRQSVISDKRGNNKSIVSYRRGSIAESASTTKKQRNNQCNCKKLEDISERSSDDQMICSSSCRGKCNSTNGPKSTVGLSRGDVNVNCMSKATQIGKESKLSTASRLKSKKLQSGYIGNKSKTKSDFKKQRSVKITTVISDNNDMREPSSRDPIAAYDNTNPDDTETFKVAYAKSRATSFFEMDDLKDKLASTPQMKNKSQGSKITPEARRKSSSRKSTGSRRSSTRKSTGSNRDNQDDIRRRSSLEVIYDSDREGYGSKLNLEARYVLVSYYGLEATFNKFSMHSYFEKFSAVHDLFTNKFRKYDRTEKVSTIFQTMKGSMDYRKSIAWFIAVYVKNRINILIVDIGLNSLLVLYFPSIAFYVSVWSTIIKY